jgi:uncharacterized OB-fold protein
MTQKLTFAQFQSDLENGNFSGLKCSACQSVTFPPQAVCRSCGGSDLDVTPLKGHGTLRTFTVIRVAPQGMTPPYVVAMAELDEGPYVLGNVVGINPLEAHMGLIGKRIKLGSQIVPGDMFNPGDSRVVTFSLI